ncbi:MAG: HIT family protein [Lachnospiraceae bacterium]|nr:HIT family protein [Lachnospiraceae bacterium]
MKKDDCIFCKIANGEIPSTTIYEDDDFRVFFDIAPASKGHCLIVPKEHFDNVFEMNEETAGKLFVLATKVARSLKKELNLEGLNIVQNNGTIAGQTVFHFHMHMIPRYTGDTVNVGWKPGEADMEELSKLAKKVGDNIL